MTEARAGGEKLRFDGRVALITGAGRGIGRAYAEWLAERGAKVIVNNRRSEGKPWSAEAVVQAIREKGGTAVADEHAVEHESSGRAMVERAMDAFGRLDILICNAAVARFSAVEAIGEPVLRESLDINLLGSLYPVLAALPRMREAGYGRIVITSSKAALYGKRDSMPYSASKTALLGFLRSLCLDPRLREANIRVNSVAPWAYTPMTRAIGPEYADVMSPQHVAKVVAWLCSERCTAHGATFSTAAGLVRRVVVAETQAARVDGEDLSELMSGLLANAGQPGGLQEPRNSDDSYFYAGQKSADD
jgi:NAD(P)-dependent dehydrogenase (short-subunit alcohol dehydrogenase family)